jgi:anti-sigma-K factor RskA
MVELNSEELRELLGAYALDAVDDDERVEVERFLSSDARARAEVAEFRELASLMANAGGDAPVGVWDRITSSIHGDMPALAPVSSPVRIDEVRRRRQSWSLRVAAVIAAVAAAAAVVLGVKVSQQDDRIHSLARAMGQAGALQRAYDAARHDSGARQAVLSEPQGAAAARVVVLPDGSGYFAGEHLGALQKGHTYQLWALVGDPANPTAISAGVLGPAPRLAAFRYHGPALAFAVTSELDPGVVTSQNQPVAFGKVV